MAENEGTTLGYEAAVCGGTLPTPAPPPAPLRLGTNIDEKIEVEFALNPNLTATPTA